MTTELVGQGDGLRVLDHDDLAITRAPELVLEEAHKAAKALMIVMEAKSKKVMFNGEQYLEFEDWQTVGRFYGITPRIPDSGSRYVEYGAAKGWEAFAEAVDVRSGRVVSSAWAMCLDDEEKWCARSKYEWQYVKASGGYSTEDPGKGELIWEKQPDGKNRPKKERRLVGEEKVPLFQLRSMAQTRAGAKALRNALAWVVVLAGYRPTPAEEISEAREVSSFPKTVDTFSARVDPAKGVGDPDTISGDRAEPEIPFAYETEEVSALIKKIEPYPKARRMVIMKRLDFEPDAPLHKLDPAALSMILTQLEMKREQG